MHCNLESTKNLFKRILDWNFYPVYQIIFACGLLRKPNNIYFSNINKITFYVSFVRIFMK